MHKKVKWFLGVIAVLLLILGIRNYYLNAKYYYPYEELNKKAQEAFDLYLDKQYQESIQLYTTIINEYLYDLGRTRTRDRSLASWYMWRSDAYKELGQYHYAINDLSNKIDLILEISSSSKEEDLYRILLNRSRLYMQQKDFNNALKDTYLAYNTIMESGRYRNIEGALFGFQPSDKADVYYLRAQIFYKSKKYKFAHEKILKSIEIKTDTEFHIYDNFYTEEFAGVLNELGYYRDMILLGKILIELQKYQDALIVFDSLYQRHRHKGNLWQRGRAYFYLENYAAAFQDFNIYINNLQSQQHTPTASAYKYRARTRASIGDYIGAYNDLKYAINIDPDDGEQYYFLGLIQYMQGDLAIGCSNLRIAAEKNVEGAMTQVIGNCQNY